MSSSVTVEVKQVLCSSDSINYGYKCLINDHIIDAIDLEDYVHNDLCS